MSFVAVPARSAGRYAQLIHIYLWTTCGIPHDFPQNVDKWENLWITFSVQRPYDNRKSRGFQGLFGADFFGKNAGYPQTDCFSGQGYPQYPVVCGKTRHKFSRGHAVFPSFSRQKVWNCAQRFSGKNFVGRGMHREKGELWRNGPSARKQFCQGVFTISLNSFLENNTPPVSRRFQFFGSLQSGGVFLLHFGSSRFSLG